ncbi:SGNH/GDSL hydrolase family protein [Glaciimonas soli]|nr:SGNH/GDSL hydrolase family protein [Glaciimonas soli]
MNCSRFIGVVFGIVCSFIIGITSAWADENNWVESWAAAPDQAGKPLQALTVREVVRTSMGGAKVRIRFSNLYGTGPVSIAAAHVALHASGSAIQPGTDHPLTFGGSPVLTMNKGESVLSDPVNMSVAPLQELAISLYIKTDTGPSTIHGVAMASTYIKNDVDATAAINLDATKTVTSWYFLSDVEVAGNDHSGSIVAVGSSIEDGVGSTMDANRRWPDLLASRLQSGVDNAGLASIGVANSGIAGNRLLRDADDPFRGYSVLHRLDRDVLDKPGVRWVILDIGINDIGASTVLGKADAQASARQIIDGMKELIARAHAKNINVIGATLTPCAGVDFGSGKHSYYSVAGETKRKTINYWIRNAHAFDGVVDFDKILRDPKRLDHINPTFDSGDHLHPNDAGYKAMADAVDLRLFGYKPIVR